MNPLLLTDGYKLGHKDQYPSGTTTVYANWTPRKSRIDGVDKVVFFGLQYFIKYYLIDQFDRYFFQQPKELVLAEYKTYVEAYLGTTYDVKHIADLHDLGYLPIEIKALKEGTQVPLCANVYHSEYKASVFLVNKLLRNLVICCFMATMYFRYNCDTIQRITNEVCSRNRCRKQFFY